MTLEERAKNAWAAYEYREGCLYNTTFEDGYVQGANEQKAIDDKECESLVGLAVKEARQVFVDKACEIVRDLANEYFGDWEQSCKFEDKFRKAMEEKGGLTMGHKIGFIAIGETIEFNGIKAVAVDAGSRIKCTDCIFDPFEDCPCTKSLTDCFSACRKDGRNIEFKLTE